MKNKKFKAVLCVWAAVLILCGSLFSPFSVLPAQAETEEEKITYTLNISYKQTNPNGSYYYVGERSFSCDAQLFLYYNGTPSSPNVSYALVVGIYDSVNDKVINSLTQSSARAYNPVCSYYRSLSYAADSGELKRDDVINDGSASLAYASLTLYVADGNSFVCDGYVFNSYTDAVNYFSFGDESGLIQAPAVSEDDEDLWEGLDPDSFYGKVLTMLKTAVFGNWSFTKFLQLFQNVIFGDWSFTKFLQLFQQVIFGNWNFESFKTLFSSEIFGEWSWTEFKDMIYTAMFGNASDKPENIFDFLRGALFGFAGKYTDIYDFFEQKTNGWDFQMIVDTIRTGMFGKTTDQPSSIWDFLRGALFGSTDTFISIWDYLETALFGSSEKYSSIWDYFNQKWGEFDLDAFSESLEEFIKTAAVGDGEHNLFGILFVPDDEVVEKYWSDIQKRFSGIFELMNTGIRIVDFLKTCSGEKAPCFTVDLGASASYYLGSEAVIIDFSWYEPYKPTVDLLFAGIVWAGFIWRMYSRIPEIIGGIGMAVSMPYRLEQHEIQNARMKETQRRSDLRWEAWCNARSNRRYR